MYLSQMHFIYISSTFNHFKSAQSENKTKKKLLNNNLAQTCFDWVTVLTKTVAQKLA